MAIIKAFVGSQDRLELQFVDTYYDPETKLDTEAPVDLTNHQGLEFRWELNGSDKTKLTLTADPDQVTRKGWATYDWELADLDASGTAKGRGWWKDANGKGHYTEEIEITVEAIAVTT
jgi:hypothetical protein